MKIFQNKIFREKNHFSARWPNFCSDRVKIAHIVEFATSKFFTLNDFFYFLGLNWSLNDVKHTNLVLQKQLISTKYFLIYTHFAVGGKGLDNTYFHPSLCKIPTSSKQHAFSDQQRECPKNIKNIKNIKICCDLSDLSAQPIDEICLFSVMTVYNTRWKVLMQSRNNTILH